MSKRAELKFRPSDADRWRMRTPKVSAGVLAGVLVAGALSASVHAGPSTASVAQAPAHVATAPHMRLAASHGVYFGLADTTPDQRHTTEQELGVRSEMAGEFVHWTRGATFPPLVTDHHDGAVPVIAWMPSGPLDEVVNGSWDGYIRTWLQGAKQRGGLIYIRLMPEMNASEPYSMGHDGNTAAKYVAAWKRVVSIGRSVGATNIDWVWNPDRAFKGSVALRPLYPGRTWVDWVAIDGFNYGTKDHGGWLWFKELFVPTINIIRQFAPYKPLMAAEVGSTQTSLKPVWMSGMFAAAPTLGFKALIYFDHLMLRDWRVASSSASLSASRTGVHSAGWITK
jgi:hypothetical protein